MSPGSELPSASPQAERGADFRDLSGALAAYPLPKLRAMAKANGLRPSSTHKADVVGALAKRFAHPTHIREALAALSSHERDLMDILDLSDEGVQGRPILDILSTLQRLNGGASPNKDPSPAAALRERLQSLASQGLVLQQLIGPERQGWRLPGIVRQHLPQLSEKLSPDRLRKVQGLRVEPSRDTALSRAAYAVWQHIQRRKISKPLPIRHRPAEYSDESLVGWETPPEEIDRLLAKRHHGWQPASDFPLTVLAPPMALPESSLRELSWETGFPGSAVDLLVLLLAELGLLSARGRRWISLKEDFPSFLRSSEAQRIQLLAKAWQATEKWSAALRHRSPESALILRRRAGQKHLKLEGLIRQLAKARRVPLRLLSRLETGSWYRFDSLLASLRNLDPNFLLPSRIKGSSNGAAWWWEEGESGHQLDPTDESSWLLIHRAYLSALWTGPLHWMGLVDLAYDDEHLTAFRLTELGGYVLGHRPEPTAGAGEQAALTVGEDLIVTVRADRADAEVHDLLGHAAQLLDAGPRVIRYRITRDTACRAFQRGLTLDAVVAILRERSENGLPPSVEGTLEGWWRRYGTIRAYQSLTLISFADDTALKEMLAVTSLEKHLIHVFSPRLAAIEPESLDILRSELVKRGYTPKVE